MTRPTAFEKMRANRTAREDREAVARYHRNQQRELNASAASRGMQIPFPELSPELVGLTEMWEKARSAVEAEDAARPALTEPSVEKRQAQGRIWSALLRALTP